MGINPGKKPSKGDKKAQAIALLQGGRIAEARALLARICRKNPADAEALMALGTAEGMLGNFSAAEASLKNSIAISHNQAGAHYSLGRAQQAQGDLENAVRSFSEACRLQPDTAAFHNSLGNVHNELGNTTDAFYHINRAAVISPDSSIYHFNLGNILNRLGRREQAIASYQRALSLQPDFIEGMVSLGNAYIYMDDLANAMAMFDRATKIQKNNPGAHAGKAAVFNKRGEYAAAAALLEPFLPEEFVDAGIAETFAKVSIHLGREQDAIVLIERLLENTKLPRADRARLCFALAFLYDRSSDFDRAFPCYAEANSLRKTVFDIPAHNRYISRIINTYSADFMKDAVRSANKSEVPVFIVGMPRSGTTLVEQILASHPHVHGAGELDILSGVAESILGQPSGSSSDPVQAIHNLTREAADRYACDYIDQLTGHDPDAVRITDKMPANFMLLGLVDLLLPAARIIHCRRNPVDTCLSCFFQDFSGYMPFSNDLTSLGMYYREYARLMKHWSSVLSVPMLEIQYEDLVTRADAVIPEIIAFCGLDWDDNCMEFHKTKRTVATASYDQVRRPLYTSSVERWRNYQGHIGELMDVLDSPVS